MKKESEYSHLTHEFGPVYDGHSKVLILGSFPSVKSRQQQFYYGHPQNRFWKVVAALTGEKAPQTVEEKRKLVLAHRIALWDVIDSCDIIGSSDSSIRNVRANDIRRITDAAPVRLICLNGAAAHRLYMKYLAESISVPAVRLPSTSPANAAVTLERLIEEWRETIAGGGIIF